MKKAQVDRSFLKLMKFGSTGLIISAIGLELWYIYANLTVKEIPPFLDLIRWVERSALFIHFIEGILAGFYAYFRGESPIKYGVYTFFTGTVSLFELFD